MSSVEVKFVFDSIREAAKFMRFIDDYGVLEVPVDVKDTPAPTPIAPPKAKAAVVKASPSAQSAAAASLAVEKESAATPVSDTKGTATASTTPVASSTSEEPKKLDYAKDIGPRIAQLVASGRKADVLSLFAAFSKKVGREVPKGPALLPEELPEFNAMLLEAENTLA